MRTPSRERMASAWPETAAGAPAGARAGPAPPCGGLDLDLLQRLLGGDQHDLRQRGEEELRPELLALGRVDRVEDEAANLRGLVGLRRQDRVGEGADRVREPVALRRVDDVQLVR